MDLVAITPDARQYLCDLLNAAGETAIVLSVNSKGCGGHSYAMQFAECAGEVIDLTENYRLILDRKSLLWLWDVQISLQDDGLGRRLDIKSPAETGRCGCGQSFTCQQ